MVSGPSGGKEAVGIPVLGPNLVAKLSSRLFQERVLVADLPSKPADGQGLLPQDLFPPMDRCLVAGQPPTIVP